MGHPVYSRLDSFIQERPASCLAVRFRNGSWTNAGGDARATAALETGATFWRSHKPPVVALVARWRGGCERFIDGLEAEALAGIFEHGLGARGADAADTYGTNSQ